MTAVEPAPKHMALLASSEGRGWGWVAAEEVLHARADFRLPAAPDHMLVMHLDRPVHAHERLGGRSGRLRAGSLAFLPADQETSWHIDQSRPAHHLHVRLGGRGVEELASEAGVTDARTRLSPAVGMHDADMEDLAARLLVELRSPALGGPLYAESLGMLLALRLLRTGEHRPADATRVGRLSRRALSAIQEMVEECLGEELSLTRMAAEAHLSPYHFARLFRATTGTSPYLYVIRRRVERAKLLLTATDWGVAEIALSVGFSSASHLAGHFRRLVGVGPAQYRKGTAGSC